MKHYLTQFIEMIKYSATGFNVYTRRRASKSCIALRNGSVSIATATALFALSCGTSGEIRPADYVNPFIGASTNVDKAGAYHGLGKTFPGATTPFGMVQVSPNTISGGDNAPCYSYEHETIEGFALTQMSGVGWYGDMGNFLVMPTTGKFNIIAGKENGSISGYRSAYDKQTETARAGYYSADLTDYGIRAETTATPHCGVMRFTYPATDTARIQVDLAHRAGGTAVEQNIRILNDSTFTGWIMCTPDGGGWGNGEGKVSYTLYFYGQLNRPMTDYGFWSADIPDGTDRHLGNVQSAKYIGNIAESKIIRGVDELTGKHIGFFTEFPTNEGEQVEMKVGVSYVDEEGARKNFMAEVEGKHFDRVAADTYDEWNRYLSKVKIEGGTDDEKTVFYTALYHTMIDPHECSDVDGRYRTGDNKIANSDGYYSRRTLFSGWDVFRSQFPLQTIINPRVVSDDINSLINLASETGNEYFERWELLNAYSGCMIGNPALPVIADAYAKGIRTFNVPLALNYAENTSNRFGTAELGYAPEDQSISKTLEYSYADWCAGQLARALGNDSLANVLEYRSQAYRNIFNSEAGWFCPRYANGSWAPWNPDKSLTQEGFGCTESNPYQQGWFVPHDVDGLVSLIGGRDRAMAMLDTLFANTPDDMTWNAYYNHANEPVHFIPFIYNRLGAPWKTQEQTRRICRDAYFNKVEGLVGNEDAGQMSAWYVLTAAGLHPSCPGDNRMEITSPVFDRIEFTLDPDYYQGKTFTVIAHDNSPENIYIDRALLNGNEYDRCYIDFDDISRGGTLELFMTSKPNHNWGTGE